MKIAFISTYPYKFCGISTFTRNFIYSLEKKFPEITPVIFTLQIFSKKTPSFVCPYQRYNIEPNDPNSYIKIANLINKSRIDLVNIQFGKSQFFSYSFYEDNNYFNEFIKMLVKPVVITFQGGVIKKGYYFYRQGFKELARDKKVSFVTLSKAATRFLIKEFGVRKEKITQIPLGLPQRSKRFLLSQQDIGRKFRQELHLKKNIILSTFGLIRPIKGQFYVIKALPKIIAEFPNVVYLIVGSSIAYEKYLSLCKKLIRDLNLVKNVIFIKKLPTVDKFPSAPESEKILAAVDIYLAPYTSYHSVTSGTITYALGIGKAVVATKTLFAKEILNNNTGIIVPKKNPEAIAQAVIKILRNSTLKRQLEQNALKRVSSCRWPIAASKYYQLFRKAISKHQPSFEEKATISVFISPPSSLGVLFKRKKPSQSFFSILLDKKVIIYTPFFLPPARLLKFAFFKKMNEKFILTQHYLINKFKKALCIFYI